MSFLRKKKGKLNLKEIELILNLKEKLKLKSD